MSSEYGFDKLDIMLTTLIPAMMEEAVVRLTNS